MHRALTRLSEAHAAEMKAQEGEYAQELDSVKEKARKSVLDKEKQIREVKTTHQLLDTSFSRSLLLRYGLASKKKWKAAGSH